MKTLLSFSLIILFANLTIAQTTAIPDVNFEQALINMGFDSGTPDGIVLTSNINTITSISLNALNISDLTGIEDFTALVSLSCIGNQLTSLNVSQNVDLIILDCSANLLTSLDVSQNPGLWEFKCQNNQLTCLNMKNGNNTGINTFWAHTNPNLTCIEVDNAAYSTSAWHNIDPASSFSVSCNNACSSNCTVFSTDNRYSCDSLLWIDGNTYYTNNNTATHTIVGGSSSGCDSLVTLNLTLYNVTTGPYLDWAYTVPANLPEGQLITKDQLGNIYVGGVFSGTVDFDPGVGIVNRTSNGGTDVYIQKIDPFGNLIWVTSIGGASFDNVAAITCDYSGDLLITGDFTGTVDFDPGASSSNLSSAGSNDAFILKLSSTGNFIWAKAMGGFASDEGRGIAVDASGNVYSIGIYSGTGDFNPGTGYTPLTSVGSNDTYIQKLDVNGNFIWVETIGGSSYDTGVDIEVDANGNIYILGIFDGTSDLRPGAAVYNQTSNGFGDVFVLKVDSNCGYKWAKTFGGSLLEQAHSLGLDNSGNVYATGSFQLTTNFNQGYAGVMNRTSNGQFDIFVIKIDPALGATLEAKTWGSTGNDEGQSIALDNSGNIYLTGYYNGTVDFSVGSGSSILTSNGGDDVFIIKIPAVFGAVDATSIGGTSNDNGISLISDNNGNVQVAGIFTGTIDFDPGIDSTILTSGGSNKLFVLQLTNSNPATSGTDVISSCGPYTWTDGNIYSTNNNTAKDTLTNMLGCDSIVTLNLTISSLYANYTLADNGNGNYSFTNTSSGNFNQTHWAYGDGNTSSTTNSNHTFSANGTFVVALTINDSNSTTPCFDYYIDTLNVTGVPSPAQCLSGFVMYPDTATSNVTVVNSSTGTNLTYFWDFGDGNTSTQAYPTHIYATAGPFYLCLTVDDGSGCNDMYCDSIGENGVVFKQAGFTINIIAPPIITGVNSTEKLISEVEIYPNPTSNQLSIATELDIAEITIIDITGKTIKTAKQNTNTINVADLPSGIYFIKLITDEKSIIKKFVKQ